MGRPINKKYFGNTNSPYDDGQTGGTTGVGGEGVDTISVATAGSFVVTNTYKNFPLLNIAAPAIPGGTQATADVVFELDTVTFASGGQTDADYLAGLSTSITGLGGGAIVNIVEVGNKVTAVNLTGGNRGEFRRGDFDGTGITSHQVLQAPNAGTDLQITVTYRVKSITMLVKGSGYTSVPSLSWNGHTFTGQTTPSGNTPTLTSNRQNALNFTAWVPTASNGTVNSGGSAVIGDIVKQQGTSRYYVKTAQGYGVCKLIADTASIGTMVLQASDANGNTYYVTRLASRKARLTQKTQNGVSAWVYATNDLAKWTLAAANGTDKALVTTTVSISNV